jgi:hypothetical protein
MKFVLETSSVFSEPLIPYFNPFYASLVSLVGSTSAL